jgi:hypothetical protein
MSCIPAVPGSACTQNIYFTDSNGVKQQATISIDLAGQFLKILKFRKAGAGFNTEYTPETTEYKDFFEDPGFKTEFAKTVSELKGEVERAGGNQVRRARSAADVNGTAEVWNDTNAGGGYYNPAPDPGNPIPVPAAEPKPGSNNVVLPEVIKKLQETADQERQLLLLPGEQQFAVQYPADAYYENSQDSVEISQFTYRAPQEQLLVDEATGNIRTSNPFQTIAQGLRRNSNLRDYVGTVRLPIPNQLAMSNGVEWGQRKANAFEAGAFYTAMGLVSKLGSGNFLEAAGAAGNVLGQAASFVGQGGLSTGTPSGTLLTALAAQYGLSKVGINVDPAQFITRATGTTINPNLELLFGGPKLRNFSLSFEFAPDNQTDATNARRIIRFFKQGMAPKRLGENLIFIGSPNVFSVKYKNGSQEIKGINAHKICALTTCEVDYTPDGAYQSYDDPKAVSQPVKTIMTLSFTELTPIFASDYDPSISGDDPSVNDAQVQFSPDSIGF